MGADVDVRWGNICDRATLASAVLGADHVIHLAAVIPPGTGVSTAGSVRCTTWLAHNHLVPALGGARRDRVAGCRSVFDFEDPSLPGWSRSGDAAVRATRVMRAFGPASGSRASRTSTTAHQAFASGNSTRKSA